MVTSITTTPNNKMLYGNAANGRGNMMLSSTNNVIDDKLVISAESDLTPPITTSPITTAPITTPERDNQLFNAISLIAGTTVGAGKICFTCFELKQ